MEQGDVINYLSYLTESFHSFADSKRIRLHFLSSVDSFQMDFDADKLMKIISNLLSNALKFTEEGGDVYLQVAIKETKDKLAFIQTSQALQLTVKDTGIGIAADKLPHIFNRFYQINDETTREKEGTGIGLAFTQELVKLLRGKIDVKSRVGVGSSFTVWLPITQLAVRSTQQNMELLVENYIGAASSNQQSIVDDVVPSNQPLLLVVEDNRDVRLYLQQCLKNKYQLIFAKQGLEGIEKAIEHTPDIIISDVMMPQKDGYELCDTLKKDIRTSHIPIILLTAKVDMDSRITGIQKGADAYIAKPFNREELLAQVEQLLNSRERLKAYYTQSIFPKPFPLIGEAENLESEFLKKITELIEEDYQKEWDIDKLCRALAMSRSQLYRKIKALTGYSTTIFIRRIRLDKAYQLLTTTDKSVSEVAYMVGINNLSFFSKSFSQVYKKSPKEVRNKLDNC